MKSPFVLRSTETVSRGATSYKPEFFYAPSLTRTIILVKENMSQLMKNSGYDDA